MIRRRPVFVLLLSGLVLFTVAAALCITLWRLPEIPVPEDPRAQWGLPRAVILTPTGHKIHVEVASNPDSRETGLMYRSVVPRGTGMLFIYNEGSSPDIWMKNTWVDLDIIWMNEDRRITAIRRHIGRDHGGLTDDTRPVYAGFGAFVLELGAGEVERMNLQKGMKLTVNIK